MSESFGISFLTNCEPHLGKDSCKKYVFFRALPKFPPPPPSPQFGQPVPLFLDVKNNVLMCITSVPVSPVKSVGPVNLVSQV